MTVAVQDPINQFIISSVSQTTGPWTWQLNQETDLTVFKLSFDTGLITTLVLGTDYTVASPDLGNKLGGTITFQAAQIPTVVGDIWTLQRNTELIRKKDFATSGDFQAVTVNPQFDDPVFMAQDANREALNALRKNPGVGDTLNPLIPQPIVNRALIILEPTTGNFEIAMSDSDFDTIVSEAAASAAAAADSANESAESAEISDSGAIDSEISANESAESADLAAQSATEAAASAAQLIGTSTTSITIGVGVKVFTTQAGKFFDAGSNLLITSDADPNNFMFGISTSYSGTTLTMNITVIGGSGTFSDWTIRVSGVEGPAGSGTIRQTIQDFKLDTQTASVGTNVFVAISGLQINITTINSNKVLIRGMVSVVNDVSFNTVLIRVKRDGTIIGNAPAAGNRSLGHTSVTVGGVNAPGSTAIEILDSPATGAHLYTVEGAGLAAGDFFVNRGVDDLNLADDARVVSSITAQEIVT